MRQSRTLPASQRALPMVWPALRDLELRRAPRCGRRRRRRTRAAAAPARPGATSRQAGKASWARSIAASVSATDGGAAPRVTRLRRCAGLIDGVGGRAVEPSHPLESAARAPSRSRPRRRPRARRRPCSCSGRRPRRRRPPGRARSRRTASRAAAQRVRHVRLVGGVGVADQLVLERELVLDAVQPAGEHRRPARGRGSRRRRAAGSPSGRSGRARPGAPRRCGCRAPRRSRSARTSRPRTACRS